MCATLSRGPNVPRRVTRGRVRPPITKRMWQSPASAPPFPSLTRAVLSTKTKQCRCPRTSAERQPMRSCCRSSANRRRLAVGEVPNLRRLSVNRRRLTESCHRQPPAVRSATRALSLTARCTTQSHRPVNSPAPSLTPARHSHVSPQKQFDGIHGLTLQTPQPTYGPGGDAASLCNADKRRTIVQSGVPAGEKLRRPIERRAADEVLHPIPLDIPAVTCHPTPVPATPPAYREKRGSACRSLMRGGVTWPHIPRRIGPSTAKTGVMWRQEVFSWTTNIQHYIWIPRGLQRCRWALKKAMPQAPETKLQTMTISRPATWTDDAGSRRPNHRCHAAPLRLTSAVRTRPVARATSAAAALPNATARIGARGFIPKVAHQTPLWATG